MSPERPSSRGPSSKPYTRSTFSPLSSPEEQKYSPQLGDSSVLDLIDDDGQPGFPTRAQYQIIERGYIESLTPRRQAKALISQALFDRIWDVLHSVDNVKENAQFRFWSRKMFTLSKAHTITLGSGGGSQRMEQEVLLHDGLLVAVREQIYDLLCFCHGSTNHGGRDKTCALIRKHYTWVPKDLVAQFIKACPTCILKKCGHSEAGTLSPPLGTSTGSPTTLHAQRYVDEVSKQEPVSPALPLFTDYFNDVDGTDGPPQEMYSNSLPSTPIHAPHSQFIFNSDHIGNSTPFEQLRRYNELASAPNLLPGFPMVREMSLFRGLPDGWQYQNIDYRTAHADCVEHQRLAPIMPYDPSLGRTRPRLPEIAPLFRADFEDFINYRADESEENSFHLSSSSAVGMSPQAEDYHSLSISPTPGEGNAEMPIDPLLLAFAASIRGSSSSVDYGSPVSTGIITFAEYLKAGSDGDMASPLLNAPSPSTIINSSDSPPPPLDINANAHTSIAVKSETTLDSMEVLRDFFRIRDGNDSGPNSSLDQENNRDTSYFWREANNGNESGSGHSSPASVRSDVSGLSLVAGIGPTSPGSMTDTPITTAPVTPVDEAPNNVNEKGRIGNSSAESKGPGKGTYEVDNGGVDLDTVIQAVSICDA